MVFFLFAIGILVLSAIAGLLLPRHSSTSLKVPVLGCVAAGVLGLIASATVLITGKTEFIKFGWSIPFGSFSFGIDQLSAVFLLAVLSISALSAVYGYRYMSVYRGKKPLAAAGFFFNVLVGSMVMVLMSRDGLSFLISWELMSLSSYFLVTFEHEKERVQKAGFIYLVATHIGTAFLMVMFLMLAGQNQTLDFAQFSLAKLSPLGADLIFLFAVIGFGTKAGLIPFHVWLPEAHPAAPSHVSAVMSGVMIKTGIYGLLRILMFLGMPPVWWGWFLVVMGLISGILGVLFALAQHELKPLLAYHSVENIGIIVIGIGLGCLGLSYELPVLAILGFAGGILHVINHAIFKSLLFLNAGAVIYETHEGNLDRLGGLLKRMPWTGATFLTGAVAISGLPPLNGFVSEFLIYLGAFYVIISHPGSLAVLMLAVIAGLALIGGLAGLCFTKAFGIAFLGEARTQKASDASEVPWLMRWPALVMAGFCFAIGLFAPYVVRILNHVLSDVTGISLLIVNQHLESGLQSLQGIVFSSLVLLVLTGLFYILRRRLLSKRSIRQSVTWDCGYAKPAPRMQYTASSYPHLLNSLVQTFIWSHHKIAKPEGIFPRHAELVTEPVDTFSEGFYRPLFKGVEWLLGCFRWLQHGRVNLYVLYVALTLFILLIWNLR